MICDLCRKLLAAEGIAPPHGALAADGRPKKLRPVMRRPVRVFRYGCIDCGANWMLDLDPLKPADSGWTWLGNARSILEPTSALAETR